MSSNVFISFHFSLHYTSLLKFLKVKTTTMVMMIPMAENEDEADSDASSVASWKSDGYHTDGGLEMQVRKGQRDARRAADKSALGEASA